MRKLKEPPGVSDKMHQDKTQAAQEFAGDDAAQTVAGAGAKGSAEIANSRQSLHTASRQPQTSSNRRGLLGAAVVGAGAGLALGGLSTPALAQGFTRLKLASPWSRDLPVLFDIAQRVADQITLVSQGSLRVEHFASNELVSPADLLTATGEGGADAYHAFDYFWSGVDPLAHLFSSVPFGMTLPEHLTWLANSGQAFWDVWGSQYNVKPMVAGGLSAHSGLWFSEAGLAKTGAQESGPIETLAGVEMRAAGLGAALLERLGANVRQMPYTRLTAALEQGDIEAVSGFVPLMDDWLKLHQTSAGLATPSFWAPMQTMTLGFNQETWAGLSEQQRQLIEVVCQSVTQETMLRIEGRNAASLTRWLDEDDLQPLAFESQFLTRAGQLSGELVEEIADSSPLAGQCVDSYLEARRAAFVWGQNGTHGFVTARALPFGFARTSQDKVQEKLAEEARLAQEAEQREREEREARLEAERQAEEQARREREQERARQAELERQREEEAARAAEARRQAQIQAASNFGSGSNTTDVDTQIDSPY